MARYLVEVEPERREEVKRSLRALGIRPIKQVLNYISVDMPPGLVPKVEALPGVVGVVEERVYKVQVEIPVDRKLEEFLRLGGPVNPLALTWSVAMGLRKERWTTGQSRKVLGVDIADKMGITGRGVKVAVLDTGFDFLGCPQKPAVDYSASTLEGEPHPQDLNGHGAHVLTTIAGSPIPTPWGVLEGVAKGVQVAAIKCLGYLIGTASTSDVIEAVAHAYNWGAKIVNMSLGSSIKPGESHDPETCPLCSLIKVLSDRGVLFAIAAGNSGKGYGSCPGMSPSAITVAALKKDLTVAGFSSREHPDYLRLSKPDVGAPGVNIGASTCGLIATMEWYDGPKIGFISGTSMATPHVAGLLALWVEYARKRGYELDRDTVMDIIRHYSEGWRSDVGYNCPRFEWIVDYLR